MAMATQRSDRDSAITSSGIPVRVSVKLTLLLFILLTAIRTPVMFLPQAGNNSS